MATGSKAGISTFKGERQALRADRIGTPQVLFSVLAASAPLMVVVGVMPTTYGLIGVVGQPLLYVILGAVLGLFSIGYTEMSRHVHNAGAFYACVARGLGGTAGAGASVVALVGYSAMQSAVYGLFGYEVSRQLADRFELAVAWWIPALAGAAVIGVLGGLKLGISARVLGTLLLAECLMVVVFDIASIAHPAAGGASLHAFDPAALSGPGLGTALCFGVAGFVGFEQSPVYAEETSRPHIVVARVTFLAVGFLAVFFAVAAWAMSIVAGPSRIVALAHQRGPALLFSLAAQRLGSTFTDVLSVFYVTGMFACLLSLHNVVARYAFAMGREGLLPAAFGRANPATGAPACGSLLQSAVSVAAVAAFAATDDKPTGDPTAPVLGLFAWMGQVGALAVTALMAVASIAMIAFFVRRGAARAQLWRIVCSGLAAVAMLVIMVIAVRDFGIPLGADPGSPLHWILPGIVGAALVVGLLHGMALRLARPDRHARIGLGNEAFQIDKARAAADAGHLSAQP
jgi:amino acid transporter